MSAPLTTVQVAERDPECNICGARLSEHVPTESGPYTHPREAAGEGRYELARPGYTRAGAWPGDDDIEMPPVYRFVPAAKLENPYGHGWSPYQ